MHPLVRLAKETVEQYVLRRQIREVTDQELTPELRQRAGVFVCLKKDGELRGCIGTFQPCEATIAEETVRNAISAAVHDPRFPPVQADELSSLHYSIDVLTPPEPVHDMLELDPKRYGVIVRSGNRRGLLLPDLDGVDTVDYQIRIAMQKAGIMPGTQIELERFEVRRFESGAGE